MKISEAEKIIEKYCSTNNNWLKNVDKIEGIISYNKIIFSNPNEEKCISINISIDYDSYDDDDEEIIEDDLDVWQVSIYHPFFCEAEDIFNFRKEEDLIVTLPRVLEIINKNISEIKIDFFKKIIEVSEKFKKIYEPCLTNYDFIKTEDKISYLDFYGDKIFTNRFVYTHIDTSYFIEFEYNYIKDTFEFIEEYGSEIDDIFLLSQKEFHELLLEILNSNPETSYLFSNDPKHTKYTSYVVDCLIDGINHLEKINKLPSISHNVEKGKKFMYDESDEQWYKHVPKQYEHYIFKYESLKEKYYAERLTKNID